MNNLGEIIKAARLAHKMSLRKASEKVGISHAHLWKIELGEEKPSEITLRKIIKGLGLSSSVLKYIGVKPPGYKTCINCEGLGFLK